MTQSVGISLPVDDGFGPSHHAELAREAETCGFDTVAVGEVAGSEALVTMAHLAGATSRIVLSTGIVSIYSRPPALAAMAFASLTDLAPGRIVAALGTSTPVMVEQWWGREFASPVSTMRDYITILRSVLAGDRVRHDGPSLSSNGFRMGLPPAEVAIVVGAVGPLLLELAAQEADGAMLTMVRPGEIADFRTAIGAAIPAERASDFSLSVSGIRAYAGDSAVDYRARSRTLLASYLHVSTHRRRLIAAAPELSNALGADASTWSDALPDQLVHELAPSGSTSIAEVVESHWNNGVDEVLLHLTGARPRDLDGCLQTIRAVASTLGLRQAR